MNEPIAAGSTTVRLCRFDELPDGQPTRFEVEGEPVVAVRLGDALYALRDECSHAAVPLSEGELDPDACTLECWRHGSAFDLRTGEPTTLPATVPVRVYEIERDGDDVVVRT